MVWEKIPEGPPDPILDLGRQFRECTAENKVNLGIGAYRDNEGKPVVLKCVREAEKKILADGVNKEYAPMTGLPTYIENAQKVMFGDSQALKEKRIASVGTISGSGALHIAFDVLFQAYPDLKVMVSSPTWGNHIPIVKKATCGNVTPTPYRYLKIEEGPVLSVDFDGMVEDIKAAPEGTVFILHPCAHNPTGCDLTPEQWRELAPVMKAHNQVAFFDSAYQGFATGSFEDDVFAVRHFIEEGVNTIVSQSFSKNLGLYGERAGAVHFVCENETDALRVRSQLASRIRATYSTGPTHGCHIVDYVCSHEDLHAQWMKDIKEMTDRIKSMRHALRDELERMNTPGSWKHITEGSGMFAFLGISREQVQKLVDEHHIFLVFNSRISVAGLNEGNVKYVAQAIHKVLTE